MWNDLVWLMSFNAIFPQYLLSQKQFSYSNSFVLGFFVTPQVYYFLQNFSQKFGTFTTGNRERLVWKPFKIFYFIYFLIYIYKAFHCPPSLSDLLSMFNFVCSQWGVLPVADDQWQSTFRPGCIFVHHWRDWQHYVGIHPQKQCKSLIYCPNKKRLYFVTVHPRVQTPLLIYSSGFDKRMHSFIFFGKRIINLFISHLKDELQ